MYIRIISQIKHNTWITVHHKHNSSRWGPVYGDSRYPWMCTYKPKSKWNQNMRCWYRAELADIIYSKIGLRYTSWSFSFSALFSGLEWQMDSLFEGTNITFVSLIFVCNVPGWLFNPMTMRSFWTISCLYINLSLVETIQLDSCLASTIMIKASTGTLDKSESFLNLVWTQGTDATMVAVEVLLTTFNRTLTMVMLTFLGSRGLTITCAICRDKSMVCIELFILIQMSTCNLIATPAYRKLWTLF